MKRRKNYLSVYEKKYHLLSDAAQFWAVLFNEAKSLPKSTLIETAAYTMNNTASRSFHVWFDLPHLSEHSDDVPSSITSITVASYFGHDAMLKLLLKEHDMRANSKDAFDQSPLSWAERNGHKATVQVLLKRNDVQADFQHSDGATLLSIAAKNEHGAIVLLLKRNDVKANTRDLAGETPLFKAGEHGHKAIVEMLLARDDVEADSQRYSWSNTAVMGGTKRATSNS